jgi:hypothetical protein
MRLKCLACEALARMVYLCAAHSPHIVDVELSRIGLHNDSDELRDYIQSRIDSVSVESYDAVVLAYGVCGKATIGLTAREIPVVLPRAHDCITLFLGTRERYNAEIEGCPGTYWYSKDYIERGLGTGVLLSLGAGDGSSTTYEDYVRKYGKDNADYLMEVMGAWQDNYQRAAFIDIGVGAGAETANRAANDALERGWAFEKIAGSLRLIETLLQGDWSDEFLVVRPGKRIKMTYTAEIVESGDTEPETAQEAA